MCQLKVELLGNLVLCSLDDFAVKLDQFATDRTDQMIVMLVVILMFISTTPVTQALFPRQPTFSQQLESPVDGGISNRRVLLLDEMVEILSTEVALCPKKDEQNQLPLGSLLQSCPADMLEKYLFLLNEFGHGNYFNPANTTTIEEAGKLSSSNRWKSTWNTGRNDRRRLKIVE